MKKNLILLGVGMFIILIGAFFKILQSSMAEYSKYFFIIGMILEIIGFAGLVRNLIALSEKK